MNYQTKITQKQNELLISIKNASLSESIKQKIEPYMNPDNPNFWEVALVLGSYFDSPESDFYKSLVTQIREFQGFKATHSKDKALVVFGTSGWRDRIGEGLTVLNVHKTVRAIIQMIQTHAFLKLYGYQSFEDVKKQGMVLLRDNRFMGDVFCEAAKKELVANGIRVFEAGECPTGVGSALVTELKAAGSINFTPSHNPMDFAGIKFNPADGGPAGKELTSIIDEKAALIMDDDAFEIAYPSDDQIQKNVVSINAKQIYKDFINKSQNFDLSKIGEWALKNKNDLLIIVDYFHGSARGFVEFLLGEDVVKMLKDSNSIEFWHTDDDVSFEGKKPEPSDKNQKPILEKLKASGKKYCLGVFMDPDADRIRFCDQYLDMEMNLFGPVMYAAQINAGLKGSLLTSVATSDFGFAIAKANDMPIHETKVGFKWFRPYISSGEALMGFEESDGISLGDTLEKDALAGLLGALMSMIGSGENISKQYHDLQEKYGYYYPQKIGVELRGISASEWVFYKEKVLGVLLGGLVKAGQEIKIGEAIKVVKNVIIDDGLKLVFDDNSWILMRPSGTEPKFRIYYEITSETKISNDDLIKLMHEYNKTGCEILDSARDMVGS